MNSRSGGKCFAYHLPQNLAILAQGACAFSCSIILSRVVLSPIFPIVLVTLSSIYALEAWAAVVHQQVLSSFSSCWKKLQPPSSKLSNSEYSVYSRILHAPFWKTLWVSWTFKVCKCVIMTLQYLCLIEYEMKLLCSYYIMSYLFIMLSFSYNDTFTFCLNILTNKTSMSLKLHS